LTFSTEKRLYISRSSKLIRAQSQKFKENSTADIMARHKKSPYIYGQPIDCSQMNFDSAKIETTFELRKLLLNLLWQPHQNR